jgi:hypothetical protein
MRSNPDFIDATLGDRRTHLSQRDADAYDAGVLSHGRGEPAPAYMTPMARGWHDAAARAAEAPCDAERSQS